MSINFALPVNTDLASGVLAQLRENISSVLTQTMGSGTNVPTGTVRLNPTSGVPEYWNGSTWSKLFFATSGGSANVQTLTVPAFISAYQDGQVFNFVAGYTNTSSATLNVNGLGAVTIKDSKTGIALTGYEILANSVFQVVYYSSAFWLVNACPGQGTWSPSYTGFSVNPSNVALQYWRNGKKLSLTVRMGNNGTSNATTFTMSAPFTAATLTNQLWGVRCFDAYDNGAYSSDIQAYISSGDSFITFSKGGSAAGFTNANGKGASFELFYPIV